MKRSLLILLILFITPSVLQAQSGEKKGDVNLNGSQELILVIDAGMEITLTGSNVQNLSYEYSFNGNDEAYQHFFQNFNPEFKIEGSKAWFIIDFPNQKGTRVNHKISTHSIDLLLPENMIVNLETRYSKVSASNFDRGLSVKNRSGLVRVRNAKQVVSVNNEYGNVVIQDVEGELSISNRSAKVDVKNIKGNVSMSTQYSKMNISKIEGTIDISNRSGTLNAFDITGDMKLSGSYMEYELTNISGDIDMSNRSGKVVINGSSSFTMSGEYTHVDASDITGIRGVEISGKSAGITLKDVTNHTYINGQYLKINLENIGGEAKITNKSAEVRIDGLEKDLVIEGEYMPITVKNFKGSNLSVVNRSNDISIEALNELEAINIESEYGDVTLNLKKAFSGSVQIETKYGKFSSTLPITMKNTTTNNNEQIISGIVGNGNGQMVIKTRNADVKINQK